MVMVIKDYNPEELIPNDEFDQITYPDRIIFNSCCRGYNDIAKS